VRGGNVAYQECLVVVGTFGMLGKPLTGGKTIAWVVWQRRHFAHRCWRRVFMIGSAGSLSEGLNLQNGKASAVCWGSNSSFQATVGDRSHPSAATEEEAVSGQCLRQVQANCLAIAAGPRRRKPRQSLSCARVSNAGRPQVAVGG